MAGRPRLRAVVARARDTTRFDAPARANRCGGGLGVLLRGASGGDGVAVWLRTADTLQSGSWPLLQRADTLSARGVVVGVRFMVGDGAHGVALDSGAVTVTRGDHTIAIAARGAGSETVAGRVVVDLSSDPVPLDRDTVSCRRRL